MLSKSRRWFIWFLPAFFSFYQYGVQSAPSLKIDYVKHHYHVTDIDISLLTIVALVAHLLSQIPMGLLLDSFDARKILTAAMLAFSFGTLLIFLANHYSIFGFYLTGHMIMGSVSTGASLGAFYLAGTWLSNDDYKLSASLTKAISMFGVLIIGLIFSFLLTYFSWPQLITGNVYFCLFMSLVFWIFIRDKEKAGKFNSHKIFTTLKSIVRNKDLWLCAVFATGMFDHFVVLTNLWRIEFLETHYHLSRYSATAYNGFTIIGYVIGAPIYGYLSQKTSHLILLMLFSAIAEFIFLSINHYFIDSLALKAIFYFTFGFFSSAMVLSFILVKQIVDHKILATAIAFINIVGFTIGVLLLAVTGELLGVLHGDYVSATTPVVIMSFVSTIAAYLLWRRRSPA